MADESDKAGKEPEAEAAAAARTGSGDRGSRPAEEPVSTAAKPPSPGTFSDAAIADKTSGQPVAEAPADEVAEVEIEADASGAEAMGDEAVAESTADDGAGSPLDADAESEPFGVEAPAGPGTALRRARESAGLELADVAEVLNLRESVVEALEEDRFDDVPVRAFARGYVRSYAKLMNEDANLLVAAFEQVATEQPVVRPLAEGDSPSWRDISMRRPALVFGGVVLLIVFAAAAVLVAFWPDVSPWDAWRDPNGDGGAVEEPSGAPAPQVANRAP